MNCQKKQEQKPTKDWRLLNAKLVHRLYQVGRLRDCWNFDDSLGNWSFPNQLTIQYKMLMYRITKGERC